ncbi:hypothetical protein C8F04DRAFT_1256927 [Mycena alexandri]|uniref:Uncharacterized protein n=1 Tax=Mycena alexandri TaxID=1745969 RepID=A0AAD6T0E6_9AGAR|nr:hypothetical protein C8F04DRAFT_1256927 [Mycena alexandri]
MCFSSHRCWRYRARLEVLFPGRALRTTLEGYIRMFILSVKDAPWIVNMAVKSVAYCRTRGAASYPFLLVQLEEPLADTRDFPVRMKLEGFDGLGTARSDLSLAHVRESTRKLVRNKYDVVHTTKFQLNVTESGSFEPSIVDLLALAEVSTKCDNSREGYPAVLLLALKTLFNALATGDPAAPPPPGNASADMNCAILDAFPAQRQRLQSEIEFYSTDRPRNDSIEMNKLRALNAELAARAARLQDTVDRLMVSAHNPHVIGRVC